MFLMDELRVVGQHVHVETLACFEDIGFGGNREAVGMAGDLAFGQNTVAMLALSALRDFADRNQENVALPVTCRFHKGAFSTDAPPGSRKSFGRNRSRDY